MKIRKEDQREFKKRVGGKHHSLKDVKKTFHKDRKSKTERK